jgi:hypothetical protein
MTDLICSLTNSRPENCTDAYCLGLKAPETCAVISSVGWVFDFVNNHQCLFLEMLQNQRTAGSGF